MIKYCIHLIFLAMRHTCMHVNPIENVQNVIKYVSMHNFLRDKLSVMQELHPTNIFLFIWKVSAEKDLRSQWWEEWKKPVKASKCMLERIIDDFLFLISSILFSQHFNLSLFFHFVSILRKISTDIHSYKHLCVAERGYFLLHMHTQRHTCTHNTYTRTSFKTHFASEHTFLNGLNPKTESFMCLLRHFS